MSGGRRPRGLGFTENLGAGTELGHHSLGPEGWWLGEGQGTLFLPPGHLYLGFSTRGRP